jgi:hypothetical protein
MGLPDGRVRAIDENVAIEGIAETFGDPYQTVSGWH